jgi:hypothetical protein
MDDRQGEEKEDDNDNDDKEMEEINMLIHRCIGKGLSHVS